MSDWLVIVDSVVAASASVLVICMVGALMFRYKYINSDFTKQLSGLIERVFLPSLIVTNFIKAVFLDQLQLVLPVIISSIVVCAFGYLVGYLCNRFWIKDDLYEQIVILSCANPHTTNIQLQVSYGLQYLLTQLTIHHGYKTDIDAGTRAISSIMIFTAINNTLRWTIGKSILLKFAQKEKEAKELIGIPLEDYVIHHDQTNVSLMGSPLQGYLLESSPLKKAPHMTSPQSFLLRVWNGLSMPLIAITLAFIIVLIPPLQKSLLDNTSVLHRAIYSPINTIGRATSACVLIMLGANIYCIMQKGGLKEAGTISKRTLISITITRLIIVPAFGFFVVMLMSASRLFQDPVNLFLTFFTFATPSAVNLILQAKQYTQSEDVVSVILMYSYLSAIVTLPMWTIFYFYFMFSHQI